MTRYLIQAAHEPEECVKMLHSYLQAGAHYLTHAEWGCEENVHQAWIIIEAESDAAARLMVPPVIRNSALVVRLNRFTPDQIRAFHEEER